MGFAVAGEVVYDGNLDHRVSAGALAQRSAGDVDQYLRGEGGIVDLHVEREELIVRASRDTFAREVHTVPHVVEGVDRFDGMNMRFVIDKIRIGLDGGGHLGEICAGFELYVHHAAVNAGAEGDGDRKGIVNAIDSERLPSVPWNGRGRNSCSSRLSGRGSP